MGRAVARGPKEETREVSQIYATKFPFSTWVVSFRKIRVQYWQRDQRMTDIWTPQKRSAVMANIRGITAPERSLRARLVQRGVSGFKVSVKIGKITPDLIFPQKKVAVFVDGCFWHGCPTCYVQPKTDTKYWSTKLAKNIARDKRQRHALRRAGWHVMRIWECQLEQKPNQQIDKLTRFLSIHSKQ